jgi:hypothetical protein
MRLGLNRVAVAGAIVFAAVWVAWGGFASPQTTGDDPVIFAPAFHALLNGHLAGFFDHLPQDGAGGSVLLRLPFAALGHAISAGEPTVFRFGALECELALAVLGFALVGLQARERDLHPADWVLVALLVLAPALLQVVHYGHPEEALGAVLCVGAVLLAGEDRPVWAGVALGLAVINKPWGILAIAPVALALDGGQRWRCALSAGAIVGAWVLTVLIGAPHPSDALAGLAGPTWPTNVWWPLTTVHVAAGGVHYRALPAPLASTARDIGGLLALAVAIPFLRRPRAVDCLALLALSFLVRCALDPSNVIYYELPFVVATAAWEARRGRPPLLALLACGGLWLVYHPIASSGGGAECAAYVLVSGACAGWIARATITERSTWVSSGGDAAPPPPGPRRGSLAVPPVSRDGHGHLGAVRRAV